MPAPQTTRVALAAAIALSIVTLANAQDTPKTAPTVVAPKPIKIVKATYTPEARAAKIQGTVVVEAVVLADGTVGQVKVTRSLDTKFGLDTEALNATQQWTFSPGTRDGKPVPVVVSIEQSFFLK
ncbi:MAG TPA: energy transducer TonB [Vicinamibacterales bacterium]|jgi:protein TonB